MNKELKDFIVWLSVNTNQPNLLDNIDEMIDGYLKSFNEHPSECRNITNNEGLKEYCVNCKYSVVDVLEYPCIECVDGSERKQYG